MTGDYVWFWCRYVVVASIDNRGVAVELLLPCANREIRVLVFVVLVVGGGRGLRRRDWAVLRMWGRVSVWRPCGGL